MASNFVKTIFSQSRGDAGAEIAGAVTVGCVGSDEFWAVVKEGRRLRQNKDFAGAVDAFSRAVKMATLAGFGAMSIEVEIARTWWHQGRVGDAVNFCEARLPDREAITLLVSILREEAHEAMAATLNEAALERFMRIKELERMEGSRRLTPRDRESIRRIKSGST